MKLKITSVNLKPIRNASRDVHVAKTLSVIIELSVGATPPTSGFEVSDPDFLKQLVDIYILKAISSPKKFLDEN